MKVAVAGFICTLLLTLATVQYVGLVFGSFQYGITSPENIIYDVNEVPLNISIRTTNGPRMGYENYVNKIFYCLDGKANVTIPFDVSQTGDESIQHYNYRAFMVLSGLSDGDHTVKIYALGSRYPFVVDSLDFAIRYSLNSPGIPTTLEPQQTELPTTLLLGSVAIIGVLGVVAFLIVKRKS